MLTLFPRRRGPGRRTATPELPDHSWTQVLPINESAKTTFLSDNYQIRPDNVNGANGSGRGGLIKKMPFAEKN